MSPLLATLAGTVVKGLIDKQGRKETLKSATAKVSAVPFIAAGTVASQSDGSLESVLTQLALAIVGVVLYFHSAWVESKKEVKEQEK